MNANKKKTFIGAFAAMILVFAGLFATAAIVNKSAASQADAQVEKASDERGNLDDVNESSSLDEKDDGTNDGVDMGNESSDEDIISVPAAQPASLGVVTKEDAIKMALTASNGNVTDVEEEQVGASAVYTVQVNKDGLETDVKIEKSTGKILKIESDTNEADNENNNDMAETGDVDKDSSADENDEKDRYDNEASGADKVGE